MEKDWGKEAEQRSRAAQESIHHGNQEINDDERDEHEVHPDLKWSGSGICQRSMTLWEDEESGIQQAWPGCWRRGEFGQDQELSKTVFAVLNFCLLQHRV
jgi:hypothetical protein